MFGREEREGNYALPIDCDLSRDTLLQRIRDHVQPESPGEYLARVKLEQRTQYKGEQHKTGNSSPTKPRSNLPSHSLDLIDAKLKQLLEQRKQSFTAPAKQGTRESSFYHPEEYDLTVEREKGDRLLSTFLRLRDYLTHCCTLKAKGLIPVASTRPNEQEPVNHRSITAPMMPKRTEKALWLLLIFGRKLLADAGLSGLIKKADKQQAKRKKPVLVTEEGTLPSTSLLVFLDHSTAESLVETICWTFDDFSNKQVLRWLYCLLARIEPPLLADIEAALTKLTRTLCCNREASSTREEANFGLQNVLKPILLSFFNIKP